MARLAGVNIPDDKRVPISLTYIYGIGQTTAEKLARDAGIDPTTRTKDLTEAELGKLRSLIEGVGVIEGDLRRKVAGDIKRLREAGSYRGERHKNNLPARGQRTKTNARTNRGRKVTMGSGRKKSAAKT